LGDPGLPLILVDFYLNFIAMAMEVPWLLVREGGWEDARNRIATQTILRTDSMGLSPFEYVRHMAPFAPI
jgi:hypothetical protein